MLEDRGCVFATKYRGLLGFFYLPYSYFSLYPGVGEKSWAFTIQFSLRCGVLSKAVVEGNSLYPLFPAGKMGEGSGYKLLVHYKGRFRTSKTSLSPPPLPYPLTARTSKAIIGFVKPTNHQLTIDL